MSKLDINQPKKAIITGITGQDGSYLAELLLEKNNLKLLVLFPREEKT